MRVVIIEDEAATMRMLTKTIEGVSPDVQVVCTMGDVKSAVAWFAEHTAEFDLVFMDIRLSDGISLEIFSQVELKTPVVFVTAYDEYLLEAFRTNGIAYILKPFDKEQIVRAIDKYKMLINSIQPPREQKQDFDFEALLQKMTARDPYRKSFFVHYRDRLIPVKTEKILWIQTENELCTAQCADGNCYSLDGTLERLMEQLNPDDFYRANRQFVVNRSAILEVHFYFNGRLNLKLEFPPKDKVLISKAKVSEFKNWMNY